MGGYALIDTNPDNQTLLNRIKYSTVPGMDYNQGKAPDSGVPMAPPSPTGMPDLTNTHKGAVALPLPDLTNMAPPAPQGAQRVSLGRIPTQNIDMNMIQGIPAMGNVPMPYEDDVTRNNREQNDKAQRTWQNYHQNKFMQDLAYDMGVAARMGNTDAVKNYARIATSIMPHMQEQSQNIFNWAKFGSDQQDNLRKQGIDWNKVIADTKYNSGILGAKQAELNQNAPLVAARTEGELAGATGHLAEADLRSKMAQGLPPDFASAQAEKVAVAKAGVRPESEHYAEAIKGIPTMISNLVAGGASTKQIQDHMLQLYTQGLQHLAVKGGYASGLPQPGQQSAPMMSAPQSYSQFKSAIMQRKGLTSLTPQQEQDMMGEYKKVRGIQ